MSLLEEVAFLKQAYQGLQSNLSEPLVPDELAETGILMVNNLFQSYHTTKSRTL